VLFTGSLSSWNTWSFEPELQHIVEVQSSNCCQVHRGQPFLQPTLSLLVSHPTAAKYIVVSLLQPTLIVGQPSYCCQVHRGQPSSANTHCWRVILLLTSSSWSAFRQPTLSLLVSQHPAAAKFIVVSLLQSTLSSLVSHPAAAKFIVVSLLQPTPSLLLSHPIAAKLIVTSHLQPTQLSSAGHHSVTQSCCIFSTLSRRIHRWLVTTPE
jgi:hypothetical protein